MVKCQFQKGDRVRLKPDMLKEGQERKKGTVEEAWQGEVSRMWWCTVRWDGLDYYTDTRFQPQLELAGEMIQREGEW